MLGSKDGSQGTSRRKFLKQIRWTSALFLPAPIQKHFLGHLPRGFSGAQPEYSDLRFVPHYPEKSPLDDILRLADPGTDEYVLEGYAFEIDSLLQKWSEALRKDPSAGAAAVRFADSAIQATRLSRSREVPIRSGTIEVVRREFPSDEVSGFDRFQDEIRNYL